jgi:proteasome lid subunit RPN8/RPN11
VSAAAALRAPVGGRGALTPGCAEALIRTASEAYPDECCGVLLGHADGGSIEAAVPLANRAADRRRAFAVAPEALVEVRKTHCRGGMDIIGFFHSHPEGEARPSASDIAWASPWAGYVHAIVGMRDKERPSVRLFRVHDRFWNEIPAG